MDKTVVVRLCTRLRLTVNMERSGCVTRREKDTYINILPGCVRGGALSDCVYDLSVFPSNNERERN